VQRANRRLLALLAVGLLAGCGSSAAPSTPAATPTAAPLSGSLTVLAAASLTEAFSDAKPTLQAANPGFVATFSFAGSQQLVTNIINGAPADVIATADQTTMQKLVTAGLVNTPATFTRNRLEIAVAPGNPKGIHTLADLARSDVSVVLAAPAVPAGNFAKQVLAKANVTVTPKSLELDVKTVLEKVESGDADAAIVYTTDVAAAASLVSGVVIPDAQNIIATYPIAVVKATVNAAAAAAFVTEAVSGLVQKALLKRGFLPP
jgi:molybdate transport system substrate-binding protein